MTRPRLLIEEWLPAQAIGVECMRERGSASALAPTTFLHVWWARRPLTISRAAVLGSLLPADFDRECFERLLGFGRSSEELVRIRALMDTGVRVEGGFGCKRAFTNGLRADDLAAAHDSMTRLWGESVVIVDPMAGGGSIPLEAARLGLQAWASEYNPVACSLLEATVDYPFRFGPELGKKARKWGKIWEERAAERLRPVYPKEKLALVHAYIFARTVPCPDTGHPTPLVHDWSLSRPRGKPHIVANPIRIDQETGEWTIDVRQVGVEAGQLPQPPAPTYRRGKGWSLFTRTEMPSDYIKAMAQGGKMGSVLYALVTKATKRAFRAAEPRDREALAAAERELARLRPRWEREGIIPTENIPLGDKTREPLQRGMTRWADMFSPRQLLALGVLVEELKRLRPDILAAEGQELGEAVVHLLALAVDKFVNHNCILSKWECTRGVIKGKFDRHDYAFRPTFGELAACVSGAGLAWSIDNVITAYEKIAKLPRAREARPVSITLGSAANLIDVDDGSITAVVVDPPYADNVQYSELADFFYVWLKRTQGHRRPEWFSTYLCERDQEAVVNVSRHRTDSKSAKEARQEAHVFYQSLMADAFSEFRRVLRDDGVLTVMFTHKKQEAWASLFESLIQAGFTITATWPIKTESPHSLNQARKNAAQSTVLLVARKRENGGLHYYDQAMRDEIRQVAQRTAARLKGGGLTAIDQLVGAFGPAMEVYSRYDEVRTDTGERVGVDVAIQVAANAVADWRVEQLAKRGLAGVDPESRFVLLCWDVLGAQEFRFNEAMLLGRSVGMDVNSLIAAGLVTKKGANVRLVSARERRRDRPVKSEVEQLSLLTTKAGRRRRGSRRKVHPSDEYYASAIDMCHALALRYAEAGGGQAGIGAARGMALQQGWGQDSPCARMMEALVKAAPQAVRFPVAARGNAVPAADYSAMAFAQFPEFRAWHAMLVPLFGIEPEEWVEPREKQPRML